MGRKYSNNNGSNKQRFHSRQQQRGRQLCPHGILAPSVPRRQESEEEEGNSSLEPHNNNNTSKMQYFAGFTVSINPMQEPKARKEMKQLLDNVVMLMDTPSGGEGAATTANTFWGRVLQLAREEQQKTRHGGGGDNESKHSDNENDDEDGKEGGKEVHQVEKEESCSPHISFSSLLAQELQQDGNGGKRSREEMENNRDRNPNRNDFFRHLDCNAKGYLFFQIPFVNALQTAAVALPSLKPSPPEEEEETEKTTNQEGLPPHSIVLNPLVSHFFDTLLSPTADGSSEENPFRSLIFSKFCFRLYPVELTCCPTANEIEKGIQLLLNYHFPPTDDQSDETNAIHSRNALSLEKPIPSPFLLRDPHADVDGDGTPKRKRVYLHKLSIFFQVKNNSNLESKKLFLMENVIKKCIPQNRFILVQKMNGSGSSPVHQLVIQVLHSTCGIGLLKDCSGGSGDNSTTSSKHTEYNLHEIAKENWDRMNATS